MGLNKFSFALKKGFNELNQVAKIMGDPEKTMSAQIVYFSLEKTSNGSAEIGSFGVRKISENEIGEHRAAYIRNHGNQAYLNMLDQLENTFARVRKEGIPLEEANAELRQKTEDFYQTYIHGEKITQTFRPIEMGLETLKKQSVLPSEELSKRRHIRNIEKRVGETVEISSDEVRKVWDLD